MLIVTAPLGILKQFQALERRSPPAQTGNPASNDK